MIALTSTGASRTRMRDLRRGRARRETLDGVARDDADRGAWWPGAESDRAAAPRSQAAVARPSPPGLILPAPVDDALGDGAALAGTGRGWTRWSIPMPWEALDDVPERQLVDRDGARDRR